MTEYETEEIKPMVEMVDVTIVESKGESALVEWTCDNMPKRAYVPVANISNSKCAQAALDAGISYGERWEDFFPDVYVTSENIADALRKAGFWTVQDVESKFKRAQSVADLLTGVNVARLFRAVLCPQDSANIGIADERLDLCGGENLDP